MQHTHSRPRHVFILCTGRCGSTTFVKAAQHMTNFTVGHETRTHLTSPARFAYPNHHIEADNRLSWLLGRLDHTFGKDPLYVHLTRDPDEVAASFLQRADRGIILAYRTEILMRAPKLSADTPLLDFCRDYVETVTENIQHFLRDKPRKMTFRLETAKSDMARLWDAIGAKGNLDAAVREWDVTYNQSPRQTPKP